MASVWKHPKSKYWTACFTDGDGRRLKKSTKEINQKKALLLADKLEQVYRTRISEATARKLLSEAVSKQLGERIATATPREFYVDFLRRKKLEVSGSTHQRYKEVLSGLIDFLGLKADDELQFITRADLEKFRDSEAVKLSASTVNLSVRIVRMFFKEAQIRELIDSSPALLLGSIKNSHKNIKRPFTLEELSKLLKVANQEWSGIIKFGLYIGQRLGDIASITWADIDLQEKEVSFRTIKTRRRVVLPLVAPLQDYLLDIPTSDKPTAPIFPQAESAYSKSGNVAPLSSQFRRIMEDAGLVKKVPHRKTKEGRGGRRQTQEISFHSLRHTATSLLKNAGVSDVVARDIIGHESAAVNAMYTHIDMDTKRSALGKLPEIK